MKSLHSSILPLDNHAVPAGSKPRPGEEKTQPPLSILPGKTTWLSVKEAAHLLSVSSATVRRLRETFDPRTGQPFLVSCKPTPRTILISAASVQAHQQASQELEFWEARKQVSLRAEDPGRKGRRKRARPAKCCRRGARARKPPRGR